MKKLAVISILSALATLGVEASAAWVSVAKVTRVRAYAGSDKVELWFDQNVTSGCTANDKVILDTSYMSTDRIDRLQAAATAAYLGQRTVEVDTSAGCVGGLGKLNYLSLK